MVRRTLITVMTSLLAAGCGGVPTSSQVRFGDEAPVTSAAQYIRVIARPPADDMEPVAVVRGFLEACADPASDFAVARQYLDRDAAAQWNPAAGVQVYDAAGLRVAEAGQAVSVTAPLQATISQDRRFALQPVASTLSQRLTVAKNADGQWRITEVADGLLLSMGDVDRTYRPWVVYFVTKDMSHLVTDTVVLPVALQGTATALVQALLSPPPAELALVAGTAFPPGTRLTYGSVPISDGIAEVDLSSDVLSADRTVRRALTAQLAYTLAQLATVGGVRLTVSGQQLTVPGIKAVTRTKDLPTFNPAPSGGTRYTAAGKTVERADAAGAFAVATKPARLAGEISRIAVDPVSGRVAALTGLGTQLSVTGGNPATLRVVHTGAVMSAPTWDLDGTLYVADFGTGVTAVPKSGKPLRVVLGRTDLGAVEQVKHLAVGPDGVRVAAVLSAGTSDVLALGSLARTKSAASIVGLRQVDRGLAAVRDLAWSGPTALLLLVADSAGVSLVTVNVANGSVQSNAAPAGAQSIAVDPSGGVYVVVADADGSSVVKRGYGQWTTVASATAVAFGP